MVAQQVSRMDDIVTHQLGRAGASGAARFAPPLALVPILNRIRVTDDGPGFADPQAVLQRRVRLDERVPGHGIGLAVVSDLVASHQGELTLSRTDSGGAQLDIVLPAA